MKIISERQRHHDKFFLKTYAILGTGCGYSFRCDATGHIDIENMNPEAKINYEYCLAGANERGEKIEPKKIHECISSWIEETIGLCDCGEEVELSGFTNTCGKCSADYNQSGQRLADRSQWGTETGEHPADIARIP